MSETVKTFNTKKYDKSLIKYRHATDVVINITDDVPTLCNDVLDLADTYKTLITKYLTSDEWISESINICNTANDISSSLKSTSINLVKDLQEMMDSIDSNNRRLKATVEKKKTLLDDILVGMNGLNLTKVTPPSKTNNTPTSSTKPKEETSSDTPEVTPIVTPTPTPTVTPSKDGDHDRTVVNNPDAIEGQNFVYDNVDGQYFDLYIPQTVEGDKPLIVYLPGIGGYGNEANLRADGGGGFFTEIDQKGMNLNAYVLTPQYPARGQYNVDDIMKSVNATIEKYGIDPSRVSIMGYSQGAEILPKVVEKYPNSFNSAVLVAKGYGISDPSVFKDIPVYGLYGDSDGYANTQTPAVIQQLQNAGYEAYVKQYSNQGHAYMPNRILEDTGLTDEYGNIVDWMLAQ